MSLLIQQHLELFDMSLTTNSLNGLVEVKYDAETKNKLDFNAYDENVSAKELFALEKAAQYEVHFVYFRKFPNRPSIPQIYIYDNTSEKVPDEDKITELHRKLYSAVQVPMFFVFTSLAVSIFNCFEQPAENGKLIYKPLETIKLAANLFGIIKDKKSKEYKNIQALSGKLFDNGSFWENSKYSKRFSIKDSVYEKLLSELKNALKELTDELKISKVIAKKLLVMGILVKYLEERTDEKGHTVFPKKGEHRKIRKNGRRIDKVFQQNFFEEYVPNASCFTDVLKAKSQTNFKHPVLNLFAELGNHFNGEFFKFKQEETEQVEQLTDSIFNRLGYFFEGEAEGKQLVLWKLYSFKDLPIELISNVYETFLDKKAGVVYTPPFLVELLLDESMPIQDTKTDFKVLDPACGSGVFLVGAYKRLIQRWRCGNRWKRPTLRTLQSLLKNIYGVDEIDEAVLLSIFSLNIALCDELSPVEIWNELRFDNLLNQQIYANDFFQVLLDKEKDEALAERFSDFDLVIGNPPFVSSLSEPAKIIEEKTKESRLLLIKEKEVKIDLPDKQIALLFLEQSINLCKENGWTTLILPASGLLYNQGAFNFRNTIFSKYHIPQIFDFTALRSSLFTNANVAASTIFVQKKAVERQGIYHITFRSIKQNKEKIYLELDNYDFHYTPKKVYLKNHDVWKSNFWGGGRIFHLMEYLKGLPTLKEYVDNQSDWVMAEGFIAATNKQVDEFEKLQNNRNNLSEKDLKKLERLEKKYKADFLTGKNTVDFDYFTENGIDRKKGINPLEVSYFHRKREKNRKIFEPPHILIREILGKKSLVFDYSNEYLTFTNQIVGIHAPKSDTKKLNKLNECLVNQIYLFYATASSSRTLLREGSLYLEDIENLPYPEDKSELELNDIENIIIEDFLEYLLPFRLRQKSKALDNAKKPDLENFATYYCKVLNSVYKNLKPYGYLKTESFICCAFYFGDDKPTIDFGNQEKAEEYLEKLVYNTTNQHLKITRVVRVYENNAIYLIKPKQVRYWLRSVAVRDADDTFSDLRKQG
jgi:ribosomal protein S8